MGVPGSMEGEVCHLKHCSQGSPTEHGAYKLRLEGARKTDIYEECSRQSKYRCKGPERAALVKKAGGWE